MLTIFAYMHPMDWITLNPYGQGVKNEMFTQSGVTWGVQAGLFMSPKKTFFNVFKFFLVKLTPEELENLNL